MASWVRIPKYIVPLSARLFKESPKASGFFVYCFNTLETRVGASHVTQPSSNIVGSVLHIIVTCTVFHVSTQYEGFHHNVGLPRA
jgi:hypothetical protein